MSAEDCTGDTSAELGEEYAAGDPLVVGEASEATLAGISYAEECTSETAAAEVV